MTLSQFTINMLSTKILSKQSIPYSASPSNDQWMALRHCGYKRTVILILTVSPLLLVTKLGKAHVGAQASKAEKLVGVRVSARYS